MGGRERSPDEIEVRRATKADAAEVARLYVELKQHHRRLAPHNPPLQRRRRTLA
jgi:hypothetical protein